MILVIILLIFTFSNEVLTASSYNARMNELLSSSKDIFKKQYKESKKNKFDMAYQITPHDNPMRDFKPNSDKVPGKMVTMLPTRPYEINDENLINVGLKYHKVTEGSLKLQLLGYKIAHTLDPNLDIDKILKRVTDDFINNINEYFKFITHKKIVFDVDKEFVAIDLIESTNGIFFSGCKLLLLTILTEAKANVTEEVLSKFNKDLLDLVNEEKAEGFKYICNKLNVCRYFPSFSDRLATLLKELIDIPEDKFSTFTSGIKQIVAENKEFFKLFMKDDLVLKIGSNLKPLLDDVVKSAKLFSSIKCIINKRHKLFDSKNREIILERKAAKILIDMIDKSYVASIGEDIADIHFNNFKDSIVEWMKGYQSDIYMLNSLTDYCHNLFDILKYHWDDSTKEEVKVLIEVIMTGKSENEKVQDLLFTQGSVILNKYRKLVHSLGIEDYIEEML